MTTVDPDLIALNHYRQLYNSEMDAPMSLANCIRLWFLGRQIDRMLKNLNRKIK